MNPKRKEMNRGLAVTPGDRAYMQIGNFTFRVKQGEFRDDDDDGVFTTEATHSGIQPIWLGFTKRKGSFYIELTGLTTEELALFKKAIIAGIEAAEVVVTRLDALSEAECYDDSTPMVPIRALKSSPPHLIRSIDPFLGVEPEDEALTPE